MLMGAATKLVIGVLSILAVLGVLLATLLLVQNYRLNSKTRVFDSKVRGVLSPGISYSAAKKNLAAVGINLDLDRDAIQSFNDPDEKHLKGSETALAVDSESVFKIVPFVNRQVMLTVHLKDGIVMDWRVGYRDLQAIP